MTITMVRDMIRSNKNKKQYWNYNNVNYSFYDNNHKGRNNGCNSNKGNDNNSINDYLQIRRRRTIIIVTIFFGKRNVHKFLANDTHLE